MEISELTLKLLILLTPGVISSLVYEKITIHKKWTEFSFILHSIFFGAINYLMLQIVLYWFWGDAVVLKFWENLPQKEIPFTEVAKAIIPSIPVGLFASWVENRKFINRLGLFLNISPKYGDENLFYRFLSQPEISEVYVRDLRTNLTYHGNVDSYNESENFNEIVLSYVSVYDSNSGDLCYKTAKVYVCCQKELMLIEFPNLNSTENEERPSQTDSKTAKTRRN